MWFEESSWSNLRLTEIVEEWRDLWPTKAEFIVCAMSYTFAMTNLLNLPKLLLENGGLAFASAYGAVLVALCLPSMILEMAVGQLTGRAPVLAFYHLFPVFKGIGVAQVLLSIIVVVCLSKLLSTLLVFAYYYGWTFYDARPSVPWLNCQLYHQFLSTPCVEAGTINNSSGVKLSTMEPDSSLMQFLTFIERPSESIADYGELQPTLLIAQAAIWIFVFCAICFGVRMIGKSISFVLFIAFSALVGLFIRTATLGGVSEVLEIYWNATDWNRLQDYRVWLIAVEQAILGTGIGFGAFITMSSYMKRSNNLVWDSIFVLMWHAIITFVQTVTIICLVGYVAAKFGLHPLDLLDKGEIQLWHILSYFTYLPKLWTGVILTISICTILPIIVLLTLTILSSVEDGLGPNWSRCCRRFFLAILVVAFCYSLTLYFSTQAGRYAYELLTGSVKYVTIYVILAFQLFATAWIYCAHKLGNDLHSMMRTKCCSCFGHFWLYFTYLLPVAPAAIAFFNAMGYSFDSFSLPITEWKWSEWIVAAVALGPLVPIPLYFLTTLLGACCCRGKQQPPRACKRVKSTFGSRLQPHPHNEKPQPIPRYTTNAPGYRLLPQAPLAEPEIYA